MGHEKNNYRIFMGRKGECSLLHNLDRKFIVQSPHTYTCGFRSCEHQGGLQGLRISGRPSWPVHINSVSPRMLHSAVFSLKTLAPSNCPKTVTSKNSPPNSRITLSVSTKRAVLWFSAALFLPWCTSIFYISWFSFNHNFHCVSDVQSCIFQGFF